MQSASIFPFEDALLGTEDHFLSSCMPYQDPPPPTCPPPSDYPPQGQGPVSGGQGLVNASNKEEVDKAILQNVLNELRKVGDTVYNDRAASARSMASGTAEEEAEEVIAEFGGLHMAGWEDVTPLQPELGMPPVVAIQYDAGDRATMELIAAVLKSGEISERVYNLTTDVIYINSASYTAWEIRWRCLEALPDLFLQKEAVFLDEMLDVNPKNYQLWNYRRRFALKRGKLFEEEEFLYSGRCLADDTKNYHAWAHRGAIAEAFGAWERELPIISKMLKEDVRNNSAWSHRFLTLQHLMERGSAEQLLGTEVEFLRGVIMRTPHNESAWHYLRGLCGSLKHSAPLTASPGEICVQVLKEYPSCSPALSLLADTCSANWAHFTEQRDEKAAGEAASQAAEILKALEVADPVRARYWQVRQAQLVPSA